MLKSPINYSMPANCPQNPLPHETSSTSSSSSSPNLWEAGLGHFSKTLASVAHCTPFSSPSSAGDRIRLWHLFCIAGPKDWLKEQKKKSIKYILAPIDASVDLLQSAHQLLLAKDSDDKRNVWEQIQGLLRSASRDCVPEERNSFVAFQAKTGVEVCTFKLVVKNASSLLDDNDPTKVKAEGMLGDLIRSFTVLNGVAKEANYQLVSDSVRSVIYILQCQFVTTTAERPISTSPDAFSSLANFLVGSLGISEKQALSTSTKRTTFQQSRGATKKEDCRCFDGYNSFPSQV